MELHRIVLLGSGGFIGTHLAAALRRQHPALTVTGVDLPAVDLTRSAESLGPLFDRGTAVVMTAGVKRQWGDTLEAFKQNVSMAVNVARVLATHPVGRFIFFSSAAVYGEAHHDEHITEETPVRPTSLYGAAKFASECVFRQSLPDGLVALRPPLIYGPGDTSQSYGPAGFVHAARQRQPVTLWGAGDERREFVFVHDVAAIVLRLVTHDFTGVLNLATGHAHTFREAAELAGATITTKPRSKPKVDHGFDNRRLIGLFPGFEFHSLADGIHETLSTL